MNTVRIRLQVYATAIYCIQSTFLPHPHLHHCRSLHFADACEIVYHADFAAEVVRELYEASDMWDKNLPEGVSGPGCQS